MATSGNATSNAAGSYYPSPNNLYFEWWQTGRSVADNWTDIQFNLKAGGGANGYWTNYSNIQLNVDGQSFSAGKTQAYNGQVLISGSKRLYHDNAGNRSFSASASAGIYTSTTNAWLSGNWTLDSIARYCTIKSAPNFNDEQNPKITFNNPSGAFGVKCKIEAGGNTQLITRTCANNATECTFNLSSTERDKLRALCPNSTSLSVRFSVCSMSGNTEASASYLDRTMSITNGTPTFSSFTYKDTNSTSVGLTGSDQILVQGVSSLQVTIPVANKATAKKKATMKNYTATISGLSKTANYSSSADVVITGFGTNFTGGNQTLSVKATDSRGLSKTVSKTVQVLAYSNPEVNATATRENNFENTTTLHVEGNYSPLTISNAEKNTVQTVQYRYKKQSTSTWGDWIAMQNITNSKGKYTADDDTLNLDNNSAWDIQVQVIDKLRSVTVSLAVSVGVPIFRIGSSDNFVYNNEQPLMPSHVGMILLTTGLATVAAVQKIYGGTWEVFGKGKTLVGVDPNDNDFKTVNKSGGTKTVTLTQAQLPKHKHAYPGGGDFVGVDGSGGQKFGFANGNYYSLTWKTGGSTAEIGSGQAHNNLQPYIVVYMYRRTA